MKVLTAKRAVLYRGRMYEPGDTLPADDARMVAAWLEAKSAEWSGTRAEAPENGQKPAQEPQSGEDNQEENQEDQDGENGQEEAQEGEAEPEMVTGHLDAEELAKWKKADLEKLAADMDVDISTAKNNAERAALIAAVPVQVPVDENGGAQ